MGRQTPRRRQWQTGGTGADPYAYLEETAIGIISDTIYAYPGYMGSAGLRIFNIAASTAKLWKDRPNTVVEWAWTR